MEVSRGNSTVASIFSIWFPNEWPEDVDQAMEAINRFYARKDEPQTAPQNSGPTAWDFVVDADTIYAGFQQRYNIDLSSAELHWWQFMALLDGLYTYSFADRIGFRTADLSNMSSKQRAEAIRKRNLYAIDHCETTEDHIAHLDKIIAEHGGGNTTWPTEKL